MKEVVDALVIFSYLVPLSVSIHPCAGEFSRDFHSFLGASNTNCLHIRWASAALTNSDTMLVDVSLLLTAVITTVLISAENMGTKVSIADPILFHHLMGRKPWWYFLQSNDWNFTTHLTSFNRMYLRLKPAQTSILNQTKVKRHKLRLLGITQCNIWDFIDLHKKLISL